MWCWMWYHAEPGIWNFPELDTEKQGANYSAWLSPNLSHKMTLAAEFSFLCPLLQMLMPEELSTIHFYLDRYPFTSYPFCLYT